jgi:putative FmdB family regulatory protein
MEVLLEMPIYEYYCESCGHEFEVMQKINDKPIKKCEACGETRAKRSISRTSFVLKGSGWYVTDYGGQKASNTKSPSSNEKRNDTSEKSKKKAANA